MIPRPAIQAAYLLYERLLQRHVSGNLLVSHVAVIQDGNRRFARHQGLPVRDGHRQGARITEKISDWCLELGIKHLTVYAFSTENFARQDDEKEYLFDLISEKLREMAVSEKTHRNRVRVRAIGRIEMLPEKVQAAIREAEDATLGYDGLYFNLALAYGGQCELADAARNLARLVQTGKIRADQVEEETIGRYLYPHGDAPVPKVDLIIRTGGEARTSNFLPWQANGNECAAYFCAPLWPEFRKIDFLRALRTSQSRMASKSTGL
ncbi:MAG: Tritrans,polycis-undecaprenyl-diphosphate synthase (GGDP specific) [Methanosaeta sp. PtaB.Bin039]|nr:MAG: Tritrans,polycis-undecaprenyl-diphosphate synthase (GGDP specific) [Methanosaeta sp. PtaB.Bin039]HQF16922.1 polyprenyl diphosphate synthase [Methanotrichaceae archaeon]HQI91489.1 polyprenyl diphosphate synthase [Methanotrichaceae archaeon]HQJ28827.1 polyprenyl diphosphate synthase [Methanotrichaceae archaeon]